MICRWDLWPHMIFLPFMGELFLYQMRETGEFSINMCSGLISPPMSSSSSDRSILHTHHSRVCVCVCVCVWSPLMSSPLGPLQELFPLRTALCSSLLWDGFFLKSSYIAPEINPFTLVPPQSQNPCSLLLSYLVSWFYVCVCTPECSVMSSSTWSCGL